MPNGIRWNEVKLSHVEKDTYLFGPWIMVECFTKRWESLKVEKNPDTSPVLLLIKMVMSSLAIVMVTSSSGQEVIFFQTSQNRRHAPKKKGFIAH